MRLKAAFIVALMLVLSLAASAGAQSVVSLSLKVYEDGYVLVNETVSTVNYSVVLEVPLLGSHVEGLLAVDQDGNVLPAEVNGSNVTVYFGNASLVRLSYYTPDLTSKDGPIWTVSLQSPVPVEITLPRNSVIVDLSDIPLEIRGNVIVMPAGNVSVSYIIPMETTTTTTTTTTTATSPPTTTSTTTTTTTSPGGGAGPTSSTTATSTTTTSTTTSSTTTTTTTTTTTSTTPGTQGGGGSVGTWLLIPILLIGVALGYAYIRRKEGHRSQNPEALRKFREKIEAMEDLNDDERGALIFLLENGGKAPQSKVREALGLPKTTAWRMFKRLEERGLVRVYKLGRENWVELVLE